MLTPSAFPQAMNDIREPSVYQYFLIPARLTNRASVEVFHNQAFLFISKHFKEIEFRIFAVIGEDHGVYVTFRVEILVSNGENTTAGAAPEIFLQRCWRCFRMACVFYIGNIREIVSAASAELRIRLGRNNLTFV